MNKQTRDKLVRVGLKPVAAALAQRGVKGRTVTKLPAADPFAGTIALTVESCRAGSVLVADLAAPAADRLRQRGIEIVSRRELRGLRPEPGDGLLRDRDSLVVIPAALVGRWWRPRPRRSLSRSSPPTRWRRAAASMACTSRRETARARPSRPGGA
jgi:hypothetical protein